MPLRILGNRQLGKQLQVQHESPQEKQEAHAANEGAEEDKMMTKQEFIEKFEMDKHSPFESQKLNDILWNMCYNWYKYGYNSKMLETEKKQ